MDPIRCKHPRRPDPQYRLIPARGWEQRLCIGANQLGSRYAVGLMFSWVSRLGDGVFWYSLMLALSLFAGPLGRWTALQMAIGGLLAQTLYQRLKRWTRRPRPFRACPGVIARIPPLDEFSFPSGHSLHAISFSLIASAGFPILAGPLLGFTLLVALSRVILGLHYPSDVLAALLIGSGLAAGIIYGSHYLLALAPV